jgi:hypothetical protein
VTSELVSSIRASLLLPSPIRDTDAIFAGCWFTSDEVRLLVNFVPRWIIIAIMLAMYTRLYLVLYRAHSPFSSSHESTTEDLSRPSGIWDSANPNSKRIKKVQLTPIACVKNRALTNKTCIRWHGSCSCIQWHIFLSGHCQRGSGFTKLQKGPPHLLLYRQLTR